MLLGSFIHLMNIALHLHNGFLYLPGTYHVGNHESKKEKRNDGAGDQCKHNSSRRNAKQAQNIGRRQL